MVDGLNSRFKWVLKLVMGNLLNLIPIRDEPLVFKFMQVHENEEYQSVGLTK